MKKKTELEFLLNENRIKEIELVGLQGQMKAATASGILGAFTGTIQMDMLRQQQFLRSISQVSSELRRLHFQINELREEVGEEIFIEAIKKIYKSEVEQRGEQEQLKLMDKVLKT